MVADIAHRGGVVRRRLGDMPGLARLENRASMDERRDAGTLNSGDTGHGPEWPLGGRRPGSGGRMT